MLPEVINIKNRCLLRSFDRFVAISRLCGWMMTIQAFTIKVSDENHRPAFQCPIKDNLPKFI
ncbi:hypothetical protein M9Y10_039035 [Tritrichomonas musculus]|uniref:Uncharacterized protein n=1 Tax=Tritrichomonas musculus TaxID=1915356 RepID=A0ABR2KD85_9EUKA